MSTALLIFDPKSLWVFWGEGAVGLKSKTKRGVFGFKTDSIVKKEIKRGGGGSLVKETELETPSYFGRRPSINFTNCKVIFLI
jgi:hypothetical protein